MLVEFKLRRKIALKSNILKGKKNKALRGVEIEYSASARAHIQHYVILRVWPRILPKKLHPRVNSEVCKDIYTPFQTSYLDLTCQQGIVYFWISRVRPSRGMGCEFLPPCLPLGVAPASSPTQAPLKLRITLPFSVIPCNTSPAARVHIYCAG
jgi:hypothetical protein